MFYFFQTFLSHKYGYRPFPAKIEASEFEKMLQVVEDDVDKDLLRKWFLKDLNMVKQIFLIILDFVSEKLFTNSS